MRKLLKKYLGLEQGHLNRSGRIERYSVMMHAFEFVAKSDLDGCYMEFGTFQGGSFIKSYHAYNFWLKKAVANKWKMKRKNMFAFDSFEGLPVLDQSDQQNNYDIFDGGQYACSEEQFLSNLKKEGVDTSIVKTIKGFYDVSLNDETKKIVTDKAMIIHVDVDLYSSCVPVMDFMTDYLQDGTLILFDDYYCYRGNKDFGVRKAFEEWLDSNPMWSAQPYFNYGWSGKTFILNSN